MSRKHQVPPVNGTLYLHFTYPTLRSICIYMSSAVWLVTIYPPTPPPTFCRSRQTVKETFGQLFGMSFSTVFTGQSLTVPVCSFGAGAVKWQFESVEMDQKTVTVTNNELKMKKTKKKQWQAAKSSGDLWI